MNRLLVTLFAILSALLLVSAASPSASPNRVRVSHIRPLQQLVSSTASAVTETETEIETTTQNVTVATTTGTVVETLVSSSTGVVAPETETETETETEVVTVPVEVPVVVTTETETPDWSSWNWGTCPNGVSCCNIKEATIYSLHKDLNMLDQQLQSLAQTIQSVNVAAILHDASNPNRTEALIDQAIEWMKVNGNTNNTQALFDTLKGAVNSAGDMDLAETVNDAIDSVWDHETLSWLHGNEWTDLYLDNATQTYSARNGSTGLAGWRDTGYGTQWDAESRTWTSQWLNGSTTYTAEAIASGDNLLDAANQAINNASDAVASHQAADLDANADAAATDAAADADAVATTTTTTTTDATTTTTSSDANPSSWWDGESADEKPFVDTGANAKCSDIIMLQQHMVMMLRHVRALTDMFGGLNLGAIVSNFQSADNTNRLLETVMNLASVNGVALLNDNPDLKNQLIQAVLGGFSTPSTTTPVASGTSTTTTTTVPTTLVTNTTTTTTTGVATGPAQTTTFVSSSTGLLNVDTAAVGTAVGTGVATAVATAVDTTTATSTVVTETESP